MKTLLHIFATLLFFSVFQNCLAEYLNLVLNHHAEDQRERYANLTEQKAYRSAAISADAPFCAGISREILRKGGKVADATIAGLVCMGAVHPHTSGIGGGFIAVHYSASTKKSSMINAREKAPLKARENMYDNKRSDDINGADSIGVPGEMMGYVELYKKFGGGVKWADLFTPTIDLLYNGFRIDSNLAFGLYIYRTPIKNDPALREAYVDPSTGEVWREGNSVQFRPLAKTLETIAKGGGELFYKPDSGLGKDILDDLRSAGAIITRDDFTKYRAKTSDAIKVTLNIPGYPEYTMHTTAAPGSGALMSFIFRILTRYSGLKADCGDSLHIFVEAMKHAYGRRGKLGDPDDKEVTKSVQQHEKNLVSSAPYLEQAIKNTDTSQTSDDPSKYMDGLSEIRGNGTASFVIIGANGDAVSVTSTVNSYFGSRVRSSKTGIVFNNQMADFATDSQQRNKHPANKIVPEKRPLSSACSSVFTNNRNQVMHANAAVGGMKIIAAVSFVALNFLWYGKTLEQAVEMPRLIHMLDPMVLEAGRGFDQNLRRILEEKGHRFGYTNGGSANSVVGRRDGQLWAAIDPRKPGSIDGY